MGRSGTTTSYTTVAKIPEFNASARVVNAAIGLYTVPANSKAKVEGSMNLDGTGADATYAIAALRGGTYVPIGEHVAVNGISRGSTELDATDILTNIGDSGSTNGTCDMDAKIQEVPT